MHEIIKLVFDHKIPPKLLLIRAGEGGVLLDSDFVS